MHAARDVHNPGVPGMRGEQASAHTPKMFDMSPRNVSSNGPIRTVSALLTAVPGFFGFVPVRSLVLLSLASDARTVHASVRLDLSIGPDGSPTPHMLAEIDNLARILHGYGSADVIAIIGDDRFEPTSPRYKEILSVVDRRMRLCGGVGRGYICRHFREGERWIQIWEEGAALMTRSPRHSGVLDDPRISPTAVAGAVNSGRFLLGNREEIASMLAPTSHCDEVCCDLGSCAIACDGWSGDASPSELMAAVFEAVVVGPDRFDCASVTELERAICDVQVRDAALAFAVTDLRSEAEILWRELTRRLGGTGRASAATLLAHLHYIAGEGSFAGVALDVARHADPSWKLAELLDHSLRNGLRPDNLWHIIGDSYEAARRLGVTLPSATLRDAS